MKFLTRSNVGAACSPRLSPLLAALVLGGSAVASSLGEVKTPRAPASGEQVKLPASPTVKAPSPVRDAAPAGESATPTATREPRAPAFKAELDRSQVLTSSDAEGTVLARGASYKARFGVNGSAYVPFFGSKAPANHPLSMRVEAVTLGGRELELSGSASVSRDGEHVDCARGAVVEQYELLPGGVEQRFVFASLPGAGDLAVRLAVETDLEASQDEQGIVFSNELGSVRYGRAKVIDATGREAAIESGLTGGAITLRVPAAFLANATFPVTIDPLITTIAIDTDLDDDIRPDVSYDLDTDTFAVVYEEAFSATDHDVVIRTYGSDGHAITGGTQYIDSSFETWVGPRIANNRIAKQFLVVAEVGAVGSRTIKGSLVSAATHVVSQAFVVPTNTSGECLNPDVGGDPSGSAPTFYCVTYERIWSPGDHDVFARLVTSAGSLVGAGPIYLEVSNNTLDSHPAISNSDGSAPSPLQAWHIAWQRTFGPSDEDIFGAEISWDGLVTKPTFLIDGSAMNDVGPSVSSPIDAIAGTREYLVVFERAMGSESDIVGFLFNGSTFVDALDLSGFTGAQALDQREPSVDCDGHQFLVGYGQEWSGADYDIHLAQFQSAGGLLAPSAPAVRVAESLAAEQHVELASVHSGGGSGTRMLATYDLTFQPNDHDVHAVVFDAQSGGLTGTFCFGSVAGCPCGNAGSASNGCANSVNAQGAHLAVAGISSVGHDTLVLSGSGMPASSNCIYLQGTATTTAAFGDGLRCVGGTLIRLAVKGNSGGSSTYPAAGDQPISVRGQVPTLGGTRYYQTWYRDPASFCTQTTYNVTNGVSAVWVP